MFKLVLQLVHARVGDAPISLVDVGCASGAFLHAATRALNLREALGVDVADELLELARATVPSAEFIEDSIVSPTALGGRTFDVCTCIGTVSIFDEIETVLENLIALVAPGGSLFVLDTMNADPVDVVMRFRTSDSDGDWRRAFNVRSVQTYERLARALEPGASISFTDFRMPFAIPRTPDPLRAWTIRTDDNPNQLVVGTGQLLDMKVLELTRP